jgi:hypothetical protein
MTNGRRFQDKVKGCACDTPLGGQLVVDVGVQEFTYAPRSDTHGHR